MNVSQGFPVPAAPLLDRDGNVTEAWRRFFLTLWNRTGEGPGISSADLELLQALFSARAELHTAAEIEAQAAFLGALAARSTPRPSQALDVAMMALLNRRVVSGAEIVAALASNAGAGAGKLLIGNATSGGFNLATLTAGSNVTITNGNGSISIAAAAGGGGTVTSVGVSGGTTGLTTSGGPITTSGNITLAGTLTVANGGTGDTTLTAHGVLIGNATGAVSITSAGTAGQLLQSQGASADPAWVSPATGGASVVLISEVVTSGSQGNVTFSSIPATYRDLIVRVRGRQDNAATQDIQVQFNGDTGSNYHQESISAYSSSLSGAQAVSATSFRMAQLPGTGATASYSGGGELLILDYRGTTFFKTSLSRWSNSTGTGAFTQGTATEGHLWISTAAINAVKLAPAAGAFVDGSVVSLYGSF